MSDQSNRFSYATYLKIDQLLSVQEPLSSIEGKPAHDEMLFIIVHQAYELWFKEIRHDLESVIQMFLNNFVDEKNIGIAVSRLQRIVQIEKLMIEQIKVIETMTPLDFLEFRNYLPGASGFQSVQFRIVENRLGLKREQRLLYANRPYCCDLSPSDRIRVEEAENTPSLFDGLERWLERTPFLQHGDFNFHTTFQAAFSKMIASEEKALNEAKYMSEEGKKIHLEMSNQTKKLFSDMLNEKEYNKKKEAKEVRLSHKAFLAALFINLYRDQPILQLPFQFLSSLLEIDEYLSLWRFRHSLMVLRMLGSKMGTGGSSGHEYLRETVDKHRIFADLFAISTFLIPRSALPPLSSSFERELGFVFSTKN